MRIVQGVVFIVIVLGLVLGIRISTKSEEKYYDIAARHVSENMAYMMDLFDLYCICFGGHSMRDEVKTLNVHLELKEPESIEMCRYKLVIGVEDLLAKINADEKLRKDLKGFPLEHSSIEYFIGYYSDEIDLSSDILNYGIARDGKVIFIMSTCHCPIESKILHEETYEEAKAIVMAQLRKEKEEGRSIFAKKK